MGEMNNINCVLLVLKLLVGKSWMLALIARVILAVPWAKRNRLQKLK